MLNPQEEPSYTFEDLHRDPLTIIELSSQIYNLISKNNIKFNSRYLGASIFPLNLIQEGYSFLFTRIQKLVGNIK